MTNATYIRENLTTVELSAQVYRDAGIGCDSELLVLWTPDSDAAIADAALDAEELVGAVEAIEAAYWVYQAETDRMVKDALRLYRLGAI